MEIESIKTHKQEWIKKLIDLSLRTSNVSKKHLENYYINLKDYQIEEEYLMIGPLSN